MKSRRCAWILCVALGVAALTGCGASSTTETTEARKESGGGMVFDESATFGQIKKMDGNTITIELGTQKKFEKENQDNGNQPDEKEQNGGIKIKGNKAKRKKGKEKMDHSRHCSFLTHPDTYLFL